jgi:hypothetical protein
VGGHAGTEAIAQNENISKSFPSQKLNGAVDVFYGVIEDALAGDLPGMGESGVHRHGVESVLDECVRQKARGAPGEKMAQQAVNLEQYRNIQDLLFPVEFLGNQQSADQEFIPGSEPDQVLSFMNLHFALSTYLLKSHHVCEEFI